MSDTVAPNPAFSDQSPTLTDPIVWTPRGFVCAFCEYRQPPNDGDPDEDQHEDDCPALPAWEAKMRRAVEEAWARRR